MGKKIGLATLAGFITLMILGFLIWGLLLMDTMQSILGETGCMLLEPNMLYISLGTLVQALFLALVLNRFGATTFQAGAVAAAWITLLISAMMGFYFLGQFSFYNTNAFLIDLVAGTVHGAIGGGIVAWVLGKVK